MIDGGARVWRRIDDDRATAASGLAVDEALARCATKTTTLRLYTYASHCALVGRFQAVEHEVDVEACARRGVAINRRPTGGGAILMGADQLGVALACPARDGGRPVHARDAMRRFSAGVVTGLAGLGVEAAFRGKNDVAVDGRKIAGLGLCRTDRGGLLFHASILVDLDVARMLDVLRTPFPTITSREVALVGRRIATVRGVRHDRIAVDTVRDAIADGFGRAFDVRLETGELDATERDTAATLEHDRYATDAWLHQRTDVSDGVGRASVRTPVGTIAVRLASAGRLAKAVHVDGDFLACDAAIADLEGRLRWHALDRDALVQTVDDVYARWGADLSGVPADALVDAVLAAAERAEPATYGCFVNPEGVR